jgi:hypothetical protein
MAGKALENAPVARPCQCIALSIHNLDLACRYAYFCVSAINADLPRWQRGPVDKRIGNALSASPAERQGLIRDLAALCLRLDAIGEHAAAAHASTAADILARNNGGAAAGQCA